MQKKDHFYYSKYGNSMKGMTTMESEGQNTAYSEHT
jgi:hypothetical protein